jgi:hypothetical protein
LRFAESFGEGDYDAPRCEINLRADVRGEWNEQLARCGFNGQQVCACARLLNVAHTAERRSGAGFDYFAADQVRKEIAAFFQLYAFGQRHLDFKSAKPLSVINGMGTFKKKNGLAIVQPAGERSYGPRRRAPI